MHPDNYNHNSHWKGDHKISIYCLFQHLLMLVSRMIKKISSESLLFSHCADELWNSRLSMLEVCVIQESWTHSKKILKLTRSNTAIPIPSLTPEIPQFFPNLLQLVVWGSIITKLLLSYFSINHCRKYDDGTSTFLIWPSTDAVVKYINSSKLFYKQTEPTKLIIPPRLLSHLKIHL